MIGFNTFIFLFSICASVCYARSQRALRNVDPLPSIIVDESIIEDDESNAPVRYTPDNVNLIKCKRYHKISKILGGRNAKPKEFPHMAALGFDTEEGVQWKCGGSLISDKFVLTAAHCLFIKNFGPVEHVRLGDLDIKSTTDDAEPQDFRIKKTYIHPSFKTPSRYHDIALIELDRKINFTKHVIPACIGLTEDLEGTNPAVTGWGLTRRGGDPANILQTAPMNYVSGITCNKTYRPSFRFSRAIDDALLICAGGGTEKTDTCQGDSGGPLQIINRAYKFGAFPEIIGVTSYGISCGLVASIYTRTFPYLSWIERIVWSYLWNSPNNNITQDVMNKN